MEKRHRVNADGSEQVMFGKVIIAEKPVRKRAHRVGWKPSLELQRLREIEKVIKLRHGSMIPDPEDTDDRETCLDYIKAAALSLSNQDMTAWCAKWAPWALDHEIAAITSLASTRRRMMTADGAAGLIRLTWADRVRLDIRTIGACDMPKAERLKAAKERKRERDRNRQEAKRREDGRKDRKSHAASTIATLKPWEAEGISRRTWFYRKAKAGCTEVSRIEVIGNGDTLVQSPAGLPPTPPPVSKQKISVPSSEPMAGGSGSKTPAELQEAAPHGNGDIPSEKAA